MKLTKQDSEVIKGAAILMLLFYHLYYYVPMFDVSSVSFAPFGVDAVMRFSRIWNVCVNMFLFVTVFGMYRSMQSRDQRPSKLFRYTVSRFIGLEMSFIAVYLVCVLAFGWNISSMDQYGTGGRAVYNAFMDMTSIGNFIVSPTINASWWYMKIAILIIFLMPVLYLGTEKLEGGFLAVLFFFPYLAEVDYTIERFHLIVMLALLCAKYELPERFVQWKIKENAPLTKVVKFICLTALVVVLAVIRQSESDVVSDQIRLLAENLLALVLIFAIFEFLCGLPVVKEIYRFLGRYSMNIYFSHLFFSYYMSVTREALFSLKHFVVIYVAFIVLSLLFAMLLDWIEKVTGYRKLTDRLQNIVIG